MIAAIIYLMVMIMVGRNAKFTTSIDDRPVLVVCLAGGQGIV